MFKGTIVGCYPQELKNVKYSISREQQFFFEQQQYIEFDELLSPKEQKCLYEATKKIAADSRDLSHTVATVQEITYSHRLAKLASELTRVRVLRFGFDQVLCQPIVMSNLQSEVCIQGLVCALFLCLDGDASMHAIFALPTADLATLPLDPEKRYFVIGWAEEKALYRLEPKDVHTHQLKKHGYVFGDRLKEKWHPILTR